MKYYLILTDIVLMHGSFNILHPCYSWITILQDYEFKNEYF